MPAHVHSCRCAARRVASAPAGPAAAPAPCPAAPATRAFAVAWLPTRPAPLARRARRVMEGLSLDYAREPPTTAQLAEAVEMAAQLDATVRCAGRPLGWQLVVGTAGSRTGRGASCLLLCL